MSFATARFQWEEGARYLAAVPDADRRTVERVADHIVDELRRRLGGPFSVDELVELHRQGTDWCLQLAYELAPETPAAWDSRVADAAYLRYAREAHDFAGGRRRAARD
ncbi:MAG: hypothetical protein JWN32_2297 [Solirubrobacterales bacterium]|nr:hypothetical protein [Solirubrobacterales bacterium]